jgi:two-component system, chemotaxis family, protein-glutamate methylesterase/glutaminase
MADGPWLAQRFELPPSSERINVLVIDDSAVVREVMTAVLSADRRITVTTAADPIIAQQKMVRQRPHVIVLDLEMPRMDGLTFLRWLMSSTPIPVVICSSFSERGSRNALLALQEGAVEVVAKPKLGLSKFLHESGVLLLDAVWSAAQARMGARNQRVNTPMPSAACVAPKCPPMGLAGTGKIIVMGASTGGTEALREVLEAMPPDAPGIAVVQHMPKGFTRSFAAHLDKVCSISVAEATSGDRLSSGQVLIAPGGQHLSIKRSGASYVAWVEDGPLVSRHRPSVDVLFRSAASRVWRGSRDRLAKRSAPDQTTPAAIDEQ